MPDRGEGRRPAPSPALIESGAVADHHEALEEFRQAHYQNYPRLHRLWLHQLRTGLHLGVAACRGVLVVLTRRDPAGASRG